MVYTVTFNPALDYVLRMEDFHPGALNRSDSEEVQYGGKGVNVSIVLKNLGVDNVALGFLAGFTGQALEEGLHRAGIRTDFIWLSEGYTRVNLKIKANHPSQETEINNPGPAIPAPALEALFQKLEHLKPGDILVLAGSLPALMIPGTASRAKPEDVYRHLLARLEGRGILTVIDAAGAPLRAVLPYHPFLIKPNNLELGELFGRQLESDGDILSCARQLQAQGARNVLVSMAGEGSLLLDETGESHRLAAPLGSVRNSVGAGDSMVAGFLAGWLEKGTYDAAHRMGTAAGSATAFSDRLATGKEIRALLPAI